MTSDGSNSSTISISLGFDTVLFLVFLVLKLCHVIDWSWWWVTSPLWMLFAILVGGAIVILLVCGVVWFFDETVGSIGRAAKRRRDRKLWDPPPWER